MAYSDAELRSVVRLIHDLNIQLKQKPLRVRMEALYNVSTENEEEKLGFRTSTTCLLDPTGDHHLGLTGDYFNYIGNLKSGDYILQVDEETVSPQYILAEQKRAVKVVPTRETFREIRQPDFTASVVEE